MNKKCTFLFHCKKKVPKEKLFAGEFTCETARHGWRSFATTCCVLVCGGDYFAWAQRRKTLIIRQL
jgi:hypothetical protein